MEPIISAGTNYTLSYDAAMTMYGMESVSIVGDGLANTIIICDSDSGLAFINVHNITISNLLWWAVVFGATLQHKMVPLTTPWYFQCGIYFLDCSDVTIYDMMHDGPGTGVMMSDTIGMVTITNSHFLHNRVLRSSKTEEFPGGGGFYIEFTPTLLTLQPVIQQ